mmetsp:Transcript_10651/g.26062  ORF Transcript_10651/g.26062 Transcript_10651/m.26062 type:complete len:434 (-) Transcript_10651:260-1561(-)
MRSRSYLVAAALPLAASLKIRQLQNARFYGPRHCVSVSRNPESGTCVLSTHCEGVNLDTVEFAFTCKKPGVLQKHSFGRGGFDPVETFDTSVACDTCGLPPEVAASLRSAAAAAGGAAAGVELEKPTKVDPARAARPPAQQPQPQLVSIKRKTVTDPVVAQVAPVSVNQAVLSSRLPVPAKTAHVISLPDLENRSVDRVTMDKEEEKVSYGPSNCIQTWLMPDTSTTGSSTGSAEVVETADGGQAALVPDGEKGVCIIKTDCGGVDTAAFEAYPVGVIAADKSGTPVRHLFGTNSFDKLEEFNTLIRASACYGLDETSEAVTLEGEVKVLSKQLAEVEAKVDGMSATQASTTAQLMEEDRQIKLFENKRRQEQDEVDRLRREHEDDRRAEEEQEEEEQRAEEERRMDEDRRIDEERREEGDRLPSEWGGEDRP